MSAPASMSPEDIIQAYDHHTHHSEHFALMFFSCHSRPNSPACMTPSKLANPNGDKEWETGSNGTLPAPEYTGEFFPPLTCRKVLRFCTLHTGELWFLCAGPKLFKEPSFKSNKFIIHNALSRCCLAGKVNETQKNKIVEVFRRDPLRALILIT